METTQTNPSPKSTEIATEPASWLPKPILEAAKLAFLIAFTLYAVGFIIWHAYLGTYGISSVEFIQTEYLAAAFCYLLLILVVGLPPTMFLDSLIEKLIVDKKTTTLVYAQNPQGILAATVAFYCALLQRVVGVYFPSKSVSRSGVLTMIVCVAVLHYIIGRATRSRYGANAVYKFFVNECWVWVYLMLIQLIQMWHNESINFVFLTDSVLTIAIFLVAVMGARQKLKRLWQTADITFKTMFIMLICMSIVGDIQLFGSSQFGLISSSIGGGKPEKAILKLSPLRFGDGTYISKTNSQIGPVFILLRSEKEIIFFESSQGLTNQTRARQIRADLVDSIEFTN